MPLSVADVSTRIRSEPLSLLAAISRGMHRVVPFQSISLLLVRQVFRRLPTHGRIRQDVFERVGGCCYVLNVFVRELLLALGFDCYYARCAIHGVEDCHMTVIVRDVLKEGDRFMVDVGCGYILPEPVCLSFDGEDSEPVQHGFLKVLFTRRDPNLAAKAADGAAEEEPLGGDLGGQGGLRGGAPGAASQPRPYIWRLHHAESTFDERECTLRRPDGFNHVFWRMSLDPRPLHDKGETQQVRAFTGYRKIRASIGVGEDCAMTYFKADNHKVRLRSSKRLPSRQGCCCCKHYGEVLHSGYIYLHLLLCACLRFFVCACLRFFLFVHVIAFLFVT